MAVLSVKLEKSAGTIDFSKNRQTDGSSQNRQQAAHEGDKRGRRNGL